MKRTDVSRHIYFIYFVSVTYADETAFFLNILVITLPNLLHDTRQMYTQHTQLHFVHAFCMEFSSYMNFLSWIWIFVFFF